jgi:hypothetical protein
MEKLRASSWRRAAAGVSANHSHCRLYTRFTVVRFVPPPLGLAAAGLRWRRRRSAKEMRVPFWRAKTARKRRWRREKLPGVSRRKYWSCQFQ